MPSSSTTARQSQFSAENSTTLRLALSRISVRDDQRRVAMREEYSVRMGIWMTDTDGANCMDLFVFSFFFFFWLLVLLAVVRLVDLGGVDVPSSQVEGRDEVLLVDAVLQVLARLRLRMVLNNFSDDADEKVAGGGPSSLYLRGSTRGRMSAICGRLAPLTMAPMPPVELSKQTGTAVRGRWSAEERMPPTPMERSMFIFRTVAGSRGTSAMR
mmetsp:Transcript_19353/g.55713  ORF Transcript_19353/g.55713 Transcript_19353/m.55713 type:complete len:213 (+) Transcript_19353:475-1113(+)